MTEARSSVPPAAEVPSAKVPEPVGSTTKSIDVSGTERTFRLYVPAGLDQSRPVPLVVMIHGGFGSAEQAENDYGWDQEADRHGFVVLYPDGQNRSWNAGSCCGPSARDNVDDVAFTTEAIDVTRKQLDIDPRRIFVTGMSNGAMMAQRLACETDIFAALGPVAGAQMVPCPGPSPQSVIQIHGGSDESVPMDGSPGNGLGRVPAHTPIPESIATWRSVNGCSAPTIRTEGDVTTSESACPEGRTVTLITVAGAGHQWPGARVQNRRIREALGMDPPSDAINATGEVWTFFAEHPKPS